MFSVFSLFLIGAGGFIGSILRFLVSSYLNRFGANIPLGTLFVNILGSFLIGLIYIIVLKINNDAAIYWRLFLGIGVMGGFTTFSTFSFETITLLERGEFFSAFSYIFLSLLLTLFFCYIGILFGRFFLEMFGVN